MSLKGVPVNKVNGRFDIKFGCSEEPNSLLTSEIDRNNLQF